MSRMWCIPITLFLLQASQLCNGGVTSSYQRKAEPAVELPIESFPPPPGFNMPEQVHITQGDHDGRSMIVSWVTPEKRHPNWLKYWKAAAADGKKAVVRPLKRKTSAYSTATYKYYTYTSGFIHHALIKDLEFDTKYYYEVGHHGSSRQFSFTTPPKPGPDVPYTFGVIGDLGQTQASNQTLEHYVANPNGLAMLFIGDLSYADDHPNHNNVKWDTWGRFIEKSAAYQPWIWTAGNHELDYAPYLGETTPFKPYTQRYHVPYSASQSVSPLWYSIKRASAYVIVLNSYSAYGKYTPQYRWLEQELPKVNRSETPWLFVLVHCPLYNSNNYHYMEGETMRVQFEPWFVQHKVDIVFAGHVHSYERTERVSNIAYNITNGKSYPVKDMSAPIYITIGDGGNIEGIANNFTVPQPDYSAYREASFGHAILEIKNRTHVYYTWHRNQDDVPVAADSTWIFNRFWFPHDESKAARI